jgi:predicted DNA-binding protein YlxM (UPF0122 family)
MSNQQYKNIGKKQIINVVSQVIHKMEAIEMTLNMFIEFNDKEDTFREFMKEKLGGKNELQSDDKADGGGDNSESNEDS